MSLITGMKNTIALDFYYNKETGRPVLFWTDVMEDKIYRGEMSGNSKAVLKALFFLYLVYGFFFFQNIKVGGGKKIKIKITIFFFI